MSIPGVVSAVYFDHEGRSYTPLCFAEDIRHSIEILGKEGPFFVGQAETGTVISIAANPVVVYDLGLYSSKLKKFVDDIDYHRPYSPLSDYLEPGAEFEVCEGWAEVLKEIASEDTEEEYLEAASDVLAEMN